MKKIIIMFFAAIAAIFVGCKSDKQPTIDEVAKTANMVGASAGFIANQFNVDQDMKEEISAIALKISQMIPSENETFKERWTPEVTDIVNKLVDNGKITYEQGELIVAVFNPICYGLDYMFIKKYPTLKQYTDLSSAAISNFVTGFLKTFNPTDGVLATKLDNTEYSVEAYEFILNSMK